VPNDSRFDRQWAVLNHGQRVNGTRGRRGADAAVSRAWRYARGKATVVIAETDTGVDYTHPDLAANVWTNPGGIGGCPAGSRGFDVLAGDCDPMDDEGVIGGHGTHVAGIMGAVGDNRIGVAGENWHVKILPVKWLGADGYGDTSALIAALQQVLAAKRAGVPIHVVNDPSTFAGTAYSQALADTIAELGANGILFVTASGNSGASNDDMADRRYPCGYALANEICVAATDQSDALWGFSNWGRHTVDMAAPGTNIYSTLRGGRYGYVSGGSMASAQVAGAAGLVLSVKPRSTASLKSLLLRSADPLPALRTKVRTGARLNVCRAVVTARLGSREARRACAR
jgi:subtilisin family serine protease